RHARALSLRDPGQPGRGLERTPRHFDARRYGPHHRRAHRHRALERLAGGCARARPATCSAPSRGAKLPGMTRPRQPLKDADLRALLSSRDLRVTPSRLRVLAELSTLSAPISHPELYDRLAPSKLDRVTVY